MKLLGYKYQIYENDEFKIYRLIKAIDTYSFEMIGENGKSIIVSGNELLDKYVRLIPDAFMNIMITDKDEDPDVYICINKSSNLTQNKTAPDIIVRQSIYSVSKLQFNLTDKIYVGDCISEFTNPSGGDLSEYMQFKNIDYTASIALYVDDTLDSIINSINDEIMENINNELKDIKDKYSNDMVEGYVDNLRDLFYNNNFICRYREIFNIMQVDWPIDLGEKSYNKDGDIILNKKQIHNIEDELRKYITNIKVIKYEKDIDISKIVSLSHLMISDSTETIYLIAYTVIGDYPIDEDIAAAMLRN